jgi:ribosomal protein S18 acetylase RimI-like enzyme
MAPHNSAAILRTRTGRELRWSVLPDLDAAAELMRVSWRENRETPMDWTADILRSYLESPGDGPVVAPALYDGTRLVAFVIGVPRTVRLSGETRRLLLISFFTVAPDWKGQGIGAELWAECLRQGDEAGYGGALHFAVEGNVSNHVTRAGARRAGMVVSQVATVRYLMRLLAPSTTSVRGPPVLDDFLAAAGGVRTDLWLARRWSRDEAEWQCRRRVDPVCVTRRVGDAAGALAGYRMRLLDGRDTRCVFVDDVLWDDLAPADRTKLLADFLAAASVGASIAVVPVLGYADVGAFQASGFRRSPRVLNAYLTAHTLPPTGDDASAMYIDVF